MSLDTQLSELVINKGLTKEQFEEAVANGLIGENDISFVDEDFNVEITVDSEMSNESTNPVQNRIVKQYVDQNISYLSRTASKNTFGLVKIGDNLMVKDGIVSALGHEAGENINIQNVERKTANPNVYYDFYAPDVIENEDGSLCVLTGLGTPNRYLRTRSAFGTGYALGGLTYISGWISGFKVRFRLTSLPNSAVYSSFFSGAYGALPKTNIKVSYDPSTDVLVFTQEYYQNSELMFIQNTYTIEGASSKLLNNWATFSLYKENERWTMNVDNLGTLASVGNSRIDLGVTSWLSIYICNSYSENHNQTDETGYFTYDIDLSKTGCFNGDIIELGFCSSAYNIRISAVDDPNKLENTATSENSITILGNAAAGVNATNIGIGSSADKNGVSVGYNSHSHSASTAIGRNAKAYGGLSTALGCGTEARGRGSIMLGACGVSSEEHVFNVALLPDGVESATDEASGLFTMLTADGKIPNGRLNISNSITSESTENEPVSAKAVYDLVGNLESLLAEI